MNYLLIIVIIFLAMLKILIIGHTYAINMARDAGKQKNLERLSYAYAIDDAFNSVKFQLKI